MQKTATVLFSTLGVIFLGLILVAGGFYMATQSGWMPAGGGFFSSKTPATNVEGENTPFTLSAAQKQALIDMGIDPAKIPSSITATQKACFVSNLGEAKFAEVQSGAVPSVIDLAKVKACL